MSDEQMMESARRINNATREDVAKAMERLPTDALEWAVKFEALSHSQEERDPDV